MRFVIAREIVSRRVKSKMRTLSVRVSAMVSRASPVIGSDAGVFAPAKLARVPRELKFPHHQIEERVFTRAMSNQVYAGLSAISW